jgi:hypothetical protein
MKIDPLAVIQVYSGALGKLIRDNNLKLKISCQTLFKMSLQQYSKKLNGETAVFIYCMNSESFITHPPPPHTKLALAAKI